MAQHPTLLCPRCGTPAEPGQRFCSECGTTLNVASNQPTSLASGEQATVMSQGAQFATQPEPGNSLPDHAASAPTQLVGAPGQSPGVSSPSQFYGQTTEANPIPPPPPPDSLIAPFNQTPYPAQAKTPSLLAQTTPAPGIVQVPDYARAPRRSRAGLIVVLVLLLVLVLGGVAAYALFFNKPNNKQGGTNPQNTATISANTPSSNAVTATTGTDNSTSTPGSNGTTPTTSANGASTEQVNLAFTYSGIILTITSVQYAASFPDDNSLSVAGVRVAFTENNAATANPNFLYSDVARLILPDQSSVAPTSELHGVSPDAQTTQPNWLDFAVTSQPTDLSQLVLQMGTAAENQMQIPLKPGADLAKYQSKTVTPGTLFHYVGLNWTLKSATEGLSASDKQATSGNVYVTLTLSVFNPQQNDYSGYYGDFARLSVAGTTNAPTTDSNFPTFIASQTSATGTLIFLVPQGTTSYTLVMLGSSNPPVNQTTVPFTIQ